MSYRNGHDDDGPDDHDGRIHEQCWCCHGEGGFHDCGEDCCCCLYPDLNVKCEECDGRGWYFVPGDAA